MVEARAMLEADWKPENFDHALRIADAYFKLGEEAEARSLISRVLSDSRQPEGLFDRNQIRGVAAMTYLKAGKTGEAREIARGIEELSIRFGVQLNMAEQIGKNGDVVKAVEILLTDCAATARLSQDAWGRVTVSAKLRIVAERLIDMQALAEAEKLLDEAVRGLNIYEPVQKDEIEAIAINLARAGKEQKAIELLTVGCGCINQEACSELSAQEFEDLKVTYLPHMWGKFFLARKDSLTPRIGEVLIRKMNSWREHGVDPAETIRVDLPILMDLMRKSPGTALDIYYGFLECMARKKIDPAYTLHAILPALEAVYRYSDHEFEDNIRHIAEFIKETVEGGIDPREALWHEIPYLAGICTELRDRFFDVFLSFKYLYLGMAKKKFNLKTSLREVLPQLPKTDIVKRIDKMRGLAEKGIDPAAKLEELTKT